MLSMEPGWGDPGQYSRLQYQYNTDHDAVYGARLGGPGAEPVLYLVDGEAAADAAEQYSTV